MDTEINKSLEQLIAMHLPTLEGKNALIETICGRPNIEIAISDVMIFIKSILKSKNLSDSEIERSYNIIKEDLTKSVWLHKAYQNLM